MDLHIHGKNSPFFLKADAEQYLKGLSQQEFFKPAPSNEITDIPTNDLIVLSTENHEFAVKI